MPFSSALLVTMKWEDDIIDTAGTLCQSVIALKEHGAKTITAIVCTYAFLEA